MAKPKGIKISKEELIIQYFQFGKTIKQIAEMYDMTEPAMSYHFRKYEINIRSQRERKFGERNGMYGKTNSWGKHSEESKKKISDALPKGKNHFRFKEPKDRIEKLNVQIRHCTNAKRWRSQILERDEYKCIFCNSTKNLHVDHIIPFAILKAKNKIDSLEKAKSCQELWDVNNGRTLCESCHIKTDTWGPKTKVII